MLTPNEIAEKRYQLSVEMGTLSGELEGILEMKAEIWNLMRQKSKSDKAADRLWEADVMGVREMKLRMQMKQKQVEISALSSLLKVAEMQAKNLW